MNDDNISYAEIYDLLMAAEDTIARVRSLLDPTVVVGLYGGTGKRYRHEIPPTHIKARDLRAALDQEIRP